MHRGMDIHSKSKVSTSQKNTWTEELRRWGVDCPWHPVAQWTARLGDNGDAFAPVIRGWCGALAGGLIGHSCGGALCSLRCSNLLDLLVSAGFPCLPKKIKIKQNPVLGRIESLLAE